MAPRLHRVGIPVATDAGGNTFTTAQIASDPAAEPYVRPLSCGECGVGVSPVRAYLNRNATAVVAHFRLAKNHHHDPGCRFDFLAECTRIQRRHPEVLTRVGELYQLNLDLLTAQSPRGAVPELRAPMSSTARPQAGGPLPSAICDIRRLLDRFAFDPQARDRFRLVYGGQSLRWSEFCFDAASEIKRFQHAIKTTDTGAPRMLVGVVSHIHASKKGDTYVADIAVRKPSSVALRPVLAARGKPILPVVRAASREALGCEAGDQIAAIGNWHLFGRLEQPTLWTGTHGHISLI